MEAAKNGVQNGNMTIREASKLYNVPFETLRRVLMALQARSYHCIDQSRGGTFGILFDTNGRHEVRPKS